MRDIQFVFDSDHSNLKVLCRGQVEVGDRLFNTLPTERDAEPSFVVEKIAGNTMTARMVSKRRLGTLKFQCLTDEEWEQRFR